MQPERYLQRFSVPFEYEVLFTDGCSEAGNPALQEAATRLDNAGKARLLIIIDAAVLGTHPGLASELEAYVEAHDELLELAAPPLILSGGEKAKNQRTGLDTLLRTVKDLHLDRHSYFVIVGGGALQDMAGYAAAIAHRGLRVIRVPTTVSSQNDSGVGVKCGINAFGIKNFLGAFSPPVAVINDIGFIAGLPERERIAGMSEAVKVALVRDRTFFDWLEEHVMRLRNAESEAVAVMIRRGAELHLGHIAGSGDPFELGSARPLDFGHWAAHKLEQLSDFELRHGEAVAIGIALDSRYCEEVGLLDGESVDRICALLDGLGFRLWHDGLTMRSTDGKARVLEGIEEFREHLGGRLTVALLEEIGRPVDVHTIDRGLVLKSIDWLQARYASR